jgi:ring-1,2-phenylacetyl-CoA epoxidase subunit PaaD
MVSTVLSDRAGQGLRVARGIQDPELPMLTLGDLGIVREAYEQDGTLIVVLTPTYLGCPAVREMLTDVASALSGAGLAPFDVRLALQPPWTSDAITDEGRRKLAAAGIAPPRPAPHRTGRIPLTFGAGPGSVPCPACGSRSTREQSRFGATACRALYRCDDCAEPFEYLKEI